MNLSELTNDELLELFEKKKGELATFDTTQQALKTNLNSLYGACASKYFRYNSRDISEGITMTGQLIIRFVEDRLNKVLNGLFKTVDKDFIIGLDTDSNFIDLSYIVNKMFSDQSDKQKIVNFLDKFIKTHIDPFLESEFKPFTNYLNAFKNMLSIKREVIADKGLFRGKKHYILQVYDKESVRYQKPKLKMMGIETAKSSTPKIVRGSLEKAIDIILNKSETDLQDYVKVFKKQFYEAPIENISFPRGVSDITKWSDPNGYPILKTPIHVKGSLNYNHLIKKAKITGTNPLIKNGDKIKFIYLKKQNPTIANCIAFPESLPSELNLDKYIDRDIQFENTFLKPLKSFTEIIHWTTDKQISLDSFFS